MTRHRMWSWLVRRPGPPVLALVVALSAALLAPSPSAFLLAKSQAPMPPACGNDGARCREELALASGWRLEAYRNFPISGSTQVTRALIVIHGAGRNPVSTFTGMMQSAALAGATSSTLVIAPLFKTEEEKPAAREATWTDDGWKQGDGATRPGGLSSFAVLDDLIFTLASKRRFPKLTHITIVGHSAGGQFTQRYAAFGTAPDRVHGVSFNYVAANSSSYVYFTSERPAAPRGFMTPSASDCEEYNTYKYGLEHRKGYVAQSAPQQVLATYIRRRVTIINGADDTFDNGNMDGDCGAMLQGANRAERGANFIRYIRKLAPSAAHDLIVVPGVDHDHYALFDSPLARGALFGPQSAPTKEGT